ncbi:MAG: molybdate ABC transporter permease subunit [Pseudomonadales bacterium]
MLAEGDLQALLLTFKLAAISTTLLMFIGTPIAWWLTYSGSKFRSLVSAVVALPLVLPPTVLGFYLLLAMSPDGPVGALTSILGIGSLAFTFWGLVLGSVVYSLPFVVQPIHNALSAMGNWPMETASTLGANAWQRFYKVVLPMCKPGFITAAALGFAHTVGEFGVVLMIGGNIPGETKVASVQIYEHVETLQYAQAHSLSLLMLLFALLTLTLVYSLNGSSAKLVRINASS